MSTTSRTHRQSRVRARRWRKQAVQYRARDLACVVDRPVRWGGAAGWLISAEVLLGELRVGEERAALEAAGLLGGSKGARNYIQASQVVDSLHYDERDVIYVEETPPVEPPVQSQGEAFDPFLMQAVRLRRQGIQTVSGRMSSSRREPPKMHNFPIGLASGETEVRRYLKAFQDGEDPHAQAVQEAEAVQQAVQEVMEEAMAAVAESTGQEVMADPISDIFPQVPMRTGVDIEDSPAIASLKPEHRAYFRAGDFGKDCAARDALKAAGLIAYDRKAKRWQVVVA